MDYSSTSEFSLCAEKQCYSDDYAYTRNSGACC